MDSRQSVVSNRLVTLAVQHPTIHTHVYWCVSAPRRGRGTEFVLSLSSVPHANVLCSVIIRVHFIPAFLALEVFAVAVAVVRKATVRPRTPLGCVVRLNLLHGDPLFRGFVGDVLKQASERPDVVPLRLWKPLSNVAQLLERDYVAVVFDGFRDDLIMTARRKPATLGLSLTHKSYRRSSWNLWPRCRAVHEAGELM